MGEHNVTTALEGERLRSFLRHLLEDLRALESMLANGMLESGPKRIGAEQELFLVQDGWRPAPAALELLEAIGDPHLTTELAAFNLEINLDPLEFSGDCFATLERQITALVGKVREAGARRGILPLLTGILPTIRKSDLAIENLTPLPRYEALNAALSRLRGEPYEFRIKGTDELILKHDSVMLEACNTSFQVHLQVDPARFAHLYNIAQVLTAPVLAAATNSPLLFGRRLWRETRIALFQQAVDTRTSVDSLRERSPRVTFGSRWVDESVLELYREDVARFRAILGADIDELPFECLENGTTPGLKALRLHNGTVYRWNRACYGVLNGKPHLRIENRVFPSGPSVVDEVANAAFWLGLMEAAPDAFGDVRSKLSFDDAKQNFVAAARLGLAAQFAWFDGRTVPAQSLVCDELLPLAQEGLERRGIDTRDIDRYLGIIRERVGSGRTGSSWIIRSLESMGASSRTLDKMMALTAAMAEHQKSGASVDTWELASLDAGSDWPDGYDRVDRFMTTDLFTVREDEPVDLVASLMDWRHIRHIPVEDNESRLVGMISYRSLLRLLATGASGRDGSTIAASDVMKREPVSISPETSTLDAIAVMRQHGISALPVVDEGRLVGIVSERDFMELTRKLLEQRFEEKSTARDAPSRARSVAE